MAEELELPSDWTRVEKWAWKQIRTGELADFNEKEKLAELLDPKTENGWTDARRLSAGFLRSILTEKRFLDATPATGVRILGALVDDAPIGLEYARLPYPFWLERSRIMTAIHARSLRVDGEFSLEASCVAGEVQLWSAKIAEGMYLSRGAFFGRPVSLHDAEIGSTLELDGSTFEGPVNMNRAQMRGSAFLRGGAVFKDELNLVGAAIGSNLEMDGSTFEGPVILYNAEVRGSAFLRRGAVFKDELNLGSAEIGSSLELNGSTFEGPVKLGGAKVRGNALIAGAVFKDELNLASAEIGSTLDLSGACFSSAVSLTNARINGELHLGSQGRAPAKWTDGSLLLRNCHCASLQDCWPTNENPAPGSWPQKIELEGFTYKQLGGYFGGGDGPWNMRKRPSDAYAAWLERDTHYSPQPYRQLARVLHESGEPTKANDIHFAARQRQRSAARDGTLKGWLAWFGLSLLRWSIGYGLGLRYFLALGWVISFTLLGAGLLEFYGKQDEKNFIQLSFASFDQLLPLITLDSAHADLFSNIAIAAPEAPPTAPDPQAGTKSTNPKLAQPDWLVAYFYGHKLVGWLLGLFLVAGVAGLTQRN